MAGNHTIFTSDMSNEECFDKMLELTKHTQGNWLIMHRDVIEYYIYTWVDEESWGEATYQLKNHNSTLSKQLVTLIQVAKHRAYDDYNKNILELSKAQCMKCTIKALAFMYMEEYSYY